MTRETLNDLAALGVHTVDISGRSGTSFTQIENARRSKRELSYLADWGNRQSLHCLKQMKQTLLWKS